MSSVRRDSTGENAIDPRANVPIDKPSSIRRRSER
jgi:hypothetical protein